MAEHVNAHISRLTELLGFDPGKKDHITADAFKEVVEEIKAERQKSIKEKAKTQLVRLMEMRDQKEKVDREYASASKKWDKEAGKMLRGIEAMLTGKPVEDENEKKEEASM